MGRGRRRSLFWDSAARNNIAYNEYIDRLTELSLSMFDWQGLPDSVDPRYLELCLFEDGASIFFKDDVIDEYMSLRMSPAGGFTVYGIPARRRAYGYNGYQYRADTKNSVIIYNNMIHTPSIRMTRVYAMRLYEIDRIIEVNCRAQKTPVLVQATEKQRLTMKNLYMQYDGNEPFIFGDQSITPDSLKAFKTDAPFVADKLYQLKTQIWNEALTYLGISNMSMVKKERMLADEVARSMGGTIASRYSRLTERQRAADKINKMFGLNISVDFRDDQDFILETQDGGRADPGEEAPEDE